jgi:uncharacterized protein YndB with AHSA1/START domain
MCTKVKPFALEPGAMLQMSWNDEQSWEARILTVNPPHTFAWEWRPGGGYDTSKTLDEQGPLTLVTFTLKEVDGGTELTVHESGFAALSAERHAQSIEDNNGGWDFCVANLTRFLEGADGK